MRRLTSPTPAALSESGSPPSVVLPQDRVSCRLVPRPIHGVLSDLTIWLPEVASQAVVWGAAPELLFPELVLLALVLELEPLFPPEQPAIMKQNKAKIFK